MISRCNAARASTAARLLLPPFAHTAGDARHDDDDKVEKEEEKEEEEAGEEEREEAAARVAMRTSSLTRRGT